MDEIFKRGTCRHFKELTPVAEEDLLTLVKAGMQARACGNQEAREFIIGYQGRPGKSDFPQQPCSGACP